MTRAGTITPRQTKDIRKKMSDYEDELKSTHAWDTATGAGVREQDGDATFNDIVTKKIKHYLDLEPIHTDRTSIKPLLTSDEIDDEATEINENSSCSSTNKIESEEREYFYQNDEEKECYESPPKFARLKEPMVNNNNDISKLDGIEMLISADKNRTDLTLNENLDISNHEKRPSVDKVNDEKRLALETNDKKTKNCDKNLIEIDC